MPLKDTETKPKNENNLNSSLNSSLTPDKKPAGIVNTIGSLLPLAPLLFEQWTGQKIPPLTGTLADMQTSLQSLSSSVQQVLQNQQQIYQSLQSLQTSAQSSLSHLTSQISQIQSVRLAHTKERREIEYNPQPEE